MKRRPPGRSIDAVVLTRLCHEYDLTGARPVDKEVLRSLRHYGLDTRAGMLRIPELRSLKNWVVRALTSESNYYVRSLDEQGFRRQEDFDLKRMSRDLVRMHPSVRREDVDAFLPFAVYLYYER